MDVFCPVKGLESWLFIRSPPGWRMSYIQWLVEWLELEVFNQHSKQFMSPFGRLLRERWTSVHLSSSQFCSTFHQSQNTKARGMTTQRGQRCDRGTRQLDGMHPRSAGRRSGQGWGGGRPGTTTFADGERTALQDVQLWPGILVSSTYNPICRMHNPMFNQCYN